MHAHRLSPFLIVLLTLAGCPPSENNPELRVSASTHAFGGGSGPWVLQVWNGANSPAPLSFDLAPSEPWINLSRTSGSSTGPGNRVSVSITLNRALIPAYPAAGAVLVSSGAGSATVTITAAAPGSEGEGEGEGDGEVTLPVPLHISFQDGAEGPVPVTVGIPMPTAVSHANEYVVRGTTSVPTQTRVLSELGDPVRLRWLLVDFQAEPGRDYALYEGSPPRPDVEIDIEAQDAIAFTVDTGAGTWSVANTSEVLAFATRSDASALITGASWEEAPVPAAVTIAESGSIRSSIALFAPQAVQGLDLEARLHFYAGLPYARMRFTLVNHLPAVTRSDAPGGDNGVCDPGSSGPSDPLIHTLDSPNTITFDGISWTVRLQNEIGFSELLYQDSSGTDYADTYLGLEPRLQAGSRIRGYERYLNGDLVSRGDVGSGSIVAGLVRFDVPWFRELFPKALRAGNQIVQIGLFPEEFAQEFALRVGEQKTHDVYVSLDVDLRPPVQVYAWPDLDWIRATGALGLIGPTAPGQFPAYEQYLADQFRPEAHNRDNCGGALEPCPETIQDARRVWDYYGWTDFGDFPTDFGYATAPYNQQFDLNLGLVEQALRSGQRRWWALAHSANVHFADIDVMHSEFRGLDVARPFWAGGIFGSPVFDETGITNPHRGCGTPAVDTYFGASGAGAWALLTGDAVAATAVIEAAENAWWRITNTDSTGCAELAWGGGSGAGEAIAGTDAIAVANVVRTLIAGYRLTNEGRFLDAAGRAGDWVMCERTRITCGNWPEALLARALGEYIQQAQGVAAPVRADALPALEFLLGRMEANLEPAGAGGLAFGACEEGPGAQLNGWLLVAADAFALGYAVTNEDKWLDLARSVFTAGSRDPLAPDDTSQYHNVLAFTRAVENGTGYIDVVSD